MSVVIRPNIAIYWYPREDITVYELAVLVRYAAGIDRPGMSLFQRWPEKFRRHFQIVYDLHDPVAVQWVEKYGVKQ